MEQLRLFIAIELPAEAKETLARLQGRLKPGFETMVKWVSPDSMHLTLQFLGGVDSDLVPRISSAMRAAAAGIGHFQLELTGLGVFPGQSRVRVVWVGLGGDVDRLLQLQKSIEAALVPLGFTPESRPFTAHLTLGRVRDTAAPEERQSLVRAIEKAALKDSPRFGVRSVNLMKSQLRPQGPIYTRITSVELK